MLLHWCEHLLRCLLSWKPVFKSIACLTSNVALETKKSNKRTQTDFMKKKKELAMNTGLLVLAYCQLVTSYWAPWHMPSPFTPLDRLYSIHKIEVCTFLNSVVREELVFPFSCMLIHLWDTILYKLDNDVAHDLSPLLIGYCLVMQLACISLLHSSQATEIFREWVTQNEGVIHSRFKRAVAWLIHLWVIDNEPTIQNTPFRQNNQR